MYSARVNSYELFQILFFTFNRMIRTKRFKMIKKINF